ncbi:MAG: hypothetical protein ABH833_01085 [Parcubacteria group bacterium]
MENIEQNQNPEPNQQGPVFEAEPGWGGRLGSWVKGHPFGSLIIVILVIAVVFIARDNDENGIEVIKLDNGGAQVANVEDIIKETVQLRDGYALVSRRALNSYIAQNPEQVLNKAQKMFIEDGLSKTVEGQSLDVGANVLFQANDIEKLITDSNQLTQYQLNVWDWYARQAGL